MIDFSFLKIAIKERCTQEYESEALSFELYQIGIEKALKQMYTKEEKINYLKNEMLRVEKKVHFNKPVVELLYNIISGSDEGKVHLKIIESRRKTDGNYNYWASTVEWGIGVLKQQEATADNAQLEALDQEVTVGANLILENAFSEMKETIEVAKDKGEVGSFQALADKQRLGAAKSFFVVSYIRKIVPTAAQYIVSVLFYGDNIKPYLLDKIEGIITPVPVQVKEQPLPLQGEKTTFPQGDLDAMPKILPLPEGYRKLAPRFSDEELWKFISFLFKETNKSGKPFLSKEDTQKLFKYGLVIPPARIEPMFTLNLGMNKSGNKSIIYVAFYILLECVQDYGTDKNYIADFLYRHFSNFDNRDTVYSSLKNESIDLFDIEPYKPKKSSYEY